jgi:hypothetical protein
MKRRAIQSKKKRNAIVTKVHPTYGFQMLHKHIWSGCQSVVVLVLREWLQLHPLQESLNGENWPPSPRLTLAFRIDRKIQRLGIVRIFKVNDINCCSVKLFFFEHLLSLIWFTVFTFFDLAIEKKNVNRYGRYPLKQKFEESAAKARAEIYNPNYTMIGENIEILRSSFSASKAAGKTWQIWAGATSTIKSVFIVHFIFIFYQSR